MTDAPALEMLGVSKRFGGVVALADAELVVRRGSVHALLGENGAGKTTLMRVAYGMVQPERAVIRVNGRDAPLGQPSTAIAAGIGMVHQHPVNVPAMSVAENLQLGRRGPFRPALVHGEARTLARSVGFDLDPRGRVADLSIADRQRLEILRAIGRGARILILDEPTAVLAPKEARELLEWLRRFAADGGTAIVITHKLEEARAYTDELTVLRGGRSVLRARSRETSADALARAMIGASVESAAPARPASPAGSIVASAAGLTLQNGRGGIAIRDASLEIRRGEIVGVAGVEGSGHHELLLALAGRLPASGGTLALPARIGFVPEDRHRDGVVLDFTLAENVALSGAGPRRGRLRWKAIAARTSHLIDRFDVRTRGPGESMRTLSGGNQQKLVLAREVDAEPELLVVDNPTRGLDIRAAAFVRDQIRSRRDGGMGVVFYSSDLDEVVESADRVLVVFAGEVRWVERERSRIGAAMLGVA